MSAAVFTARDARQRRHLLSALDDALEASGIVELVADEAYEGEDTSLYLWTFYFIGAQDGLRYGKVKGRETAFTPGPAHAVARAKARQRARKGRKAGRR